MLQIGSALAMADSGVTQTKIMYKHILAVSKLYFRGMLLLSEYDTFKN